MLLSTRQRVGTLERPVGEADSVEAFERFTTHRLRVAQDAVSRPADPAERPGQDVFETREPTDDVELLEDEADVATELAEFLAAGGDHVVAEHLDVAARGHVQLVQMAQQGRLA